MGGEGPGASYPNYGGPSDSHGSPGCPAFSISLRVMDPVPGIPTENMQLGWGIPGGKGPFPVGLASASSWAPTWMPPFPPVHFGWGWGIPGWTLWALVLPVDSASPYCCLPPRFIGPYLVLPALGLLAATQVGISFRVACPAVRPVHPPDSTFMTAFLWLAWRSYLLPSPLGDFPPLCLPSVPGLRWLIWVLVACLAVLYPCCCGTSLCKIGDRSSLCCEDGDPPCPSA